MQELLDALAQKVALELVSNSKLAEILSGYIATSSINNTGLVTEEGFVADARQMNPNVAGSLAAKVKKNTDDIVTANSNLANVSSTATTANNKVQLDGGPIKIIAYAGDGNWSFQQQYGDGHILSLSINDTQIAYDYYDGKNWTRKWTK